jgi:hypothetical protein
MYLEPISDFNGKKTTVPASLLLDMTSLKEMQRELGA